LAAKGSFNDCFFKILSREALHIGTLTVLGPADDKMSESEELTTQFVSNSTGATKILQQQPPN